MAISVTQAGDEGWKFEVWGRLATGGGTYANVGNAHNQDKVKDHIPPDFRAGPEFRERNTTGAL